MRSRYLSARHGKKELSNYAQELRTVVADMQLFPLQEMVLVTVSMEGRRTGVARTEVIQVYPKSFEAAVDIALNADFNFKAVRLASICMWWSRFSKLRVEPPKHSRRRTANLRGTGFPDSVYGP